MSIFLKENIKISLQDIIKFLPAHVYWLNTEMCFLGCNEAQAKMSGLSSPKEVIGKTLYDFAPKEIADAVIKNNQLVLSQKKSLTFEETAILLDGSKQIYLSEKSPLFNDQGNVIGILGVSFNITKKKQLEENKDILLEEIISNLPGNVYWKNRQGVYMGCNFNMAKIIKISSSQKIIGKNLYDLHPDKPEIAKNISDEDEKIMQTNQARTFEERGLDTNRKNAIYLTSKVPLSNREGKVIGLLGLSFDITDRKKAEQELQESFRKIKAANDAKSEMLSIISTEIRTPLNNIAGIIDLLAHSALETKQKTYVQLAQQSNLSIMPLLDYIQDYLNAESGKVKFLQEELAVQSIFENIVRQFASEAYAKNVDLLIQYPSNFPEIIITDSNRFCQILTIFFSNAVKYTSSGEIILSAEILAEKQIKISVKDTGEGLSKKRQHYLFNLFDISEDNDKSHRHAGLRLSICRQLLRLQGGDAGVNSEQGKGADFWFTLPLQLPAHKKIKKFKAFKENFTQIIDESLNILIVDDNLARANIIASYFEHKKTSIVKSEKAWEILYQSTKNHCLFDLILINQHLYNVNSAALIKKIEAEPAFNKIAVILLTYPASNENIALHFGRYGQVSCLEKPFYPSSFLSEINRIYHTPRKTLPKVLLVEDNLINQKVLQDLLEKLGCQVDAVTHGFQAIIKINTPKTPYDMVFMDINLPDKNGIYVTAEIKSQPKYENLPIIGITAHISEEDMEKMLEAGASQVILKPISIDILMKIVQHYIHNPIIDERG